MIPPRQVLPPPTYQAPKLEDVLGGELEKNQKLKQIKLKYGVPDKPQAAPKMQWMGDNNS